MTDAYLEVGDAAGAAFFHRGIAGAVVMLNLLRFRDIADHGATPALAGGGAVSGRVAFDRYIAHTLPFLRASGGDLVLLAEGGPWLIGPPGERWDMAMLVRQASVAVFMAWNADPAYLAGFGHRTAALADSRLLPLVEHSPDKG